MYKPSAESLDELYNPVVRTLIRQVNSLTSDFIDHQNTDYYKQYENVKSSKKSLRSSNSRVKSNEY